MLQWGGRRVVMAKELNSDLKVKKFKLQPRFYVHFKGRFLWYNG